MSPLKVTQVRSVIGSKQGHKRTVRALGLKRIRD
ncbi:MAG TPA: uL30 family ribosomal protein, partial [Rubrobacter sp.]|nr:uL30 family ribosomal protein [Rubrobacter sp.]